MAIRVRYIYQEMKKYDIKLVAGEKGMRKEVKWTHIIENEESTMSLQGLEIVFITRINTGNLKELLNLIKLTKSKNASAVVIKGVNNSNINQEIINFCNKNNYSLFIIPNNIDIYRLMKEITLKIIESEQMYVGITNAIKDAIFLPTHEDVYIPIFEKNGFRKGWSYNVSIIEVCINENNTEEYVNKIRKIIEDDYTYITNKLFTVSVGKVIIIIFYNKLQTEIDKIIKEVYTKSIKNSKNLKLYIGTSSQEVSLNNLYKGYEEAKNMVKVNKLIGNKNISIRYSEMAIYKLLLAVENVDRIKGFYNESIKDLDVYDKVNNTNYIQLLTNYFDNNCCINKTANDLNIHRNTVSNKLNKIQEILDIDLNDIGDKSKLYLATMIGNII